MPEFLSWDETSIQDKLRVLNSFNDQWQQLQHSVKKIKGYDTKKLDFVMDENNKIYIIATLGKKDLHRAVLCIFRFNDNNEFSLQAQFCLSNSKASGSKCFGASNSCYAFCNVGKPAIYFFEFEDEPAESYSLKEYQLSSNALLRNFWEPFHFEFKSEGRPYWIIDLQFSHSNHVASTKEEWMAK